VSLSLDPSVTGMLDPTVAGKTTMMLVSTFGAVMNPIDAQLPLFPYGPDGAWAASRLLWTGLAAGAAIAVAASCTDGRPAGASRWTVPGARAPVRRRPHVRGGPS